MKEKRGKTHKKPKTRQIEKSSFFKPKRFSFFALSVDFKTKNERKTHFDFSFLCVSNNNKKQIEFLVFLFWFFIFSKTTKTQTTQKTKEKR
jgi:hypothetical protein